MKSTRLAQLRRAGSGLESLLVAVLSIAGALATVALVLALIGAPAGAAFSSMFRASVGGTSELATTVIKALPRLIAALGIAIAIRANLWNIGAEGQIYIGAVAATATVFALDGLPAGVVPVVALMAAVVAGGVWGGIPGFLKAKRGINEVITTLMLVYIAIEFTRYMISGPWSVSGATFPATERFDASARLPNILPGTILNAGAIVALVAVGVMWFIMQRTAFGLDIRSIGSNVDAAHFLGVKVNKVIIVTLFVSGGFGGLAGAVEVLGVRGRLIDGFSSGFGFEAIAVALLGRMHPVGMVGAALLFGALDAGGTGLATSIPGVSSAIVLVAAGLSVLYVLFGQGLVDRMRRATRMKESLRKRSATGKVWLHTDKPEASESEVNDSRRDVEKYNQSSSDNRVETGRGHES